MVVTNSGLKNGDKVVKSGSLGSATLGSGLETLDNPTTGAIGDFVTLSGFGHITKSGGIGGDVTLNTGWTINKGGIDGAFSFAGSATAGLINRGAIAQGVAISSANDTISFAGLTGVATIAGFQASDVLGFNTAVFANFAAVQHAMTQVGSDVRITHDAADRVTLKGATLASLSASNFAFS